MTQSAEENSSPVNRIKRRLLGDNVNLSAHIRLLAAPAYGRIISYEGLLRFVIPLVSLMFICVVAVYRGTELASDYTRVEAEAEFKLDLIATSLATRLNNAEDTLNDQVFKVQLQAELAESLPPNAVSEGRQVFVASTLGEILATAPNNPEYEGLHLPDLLIADQPLFVFGERAGIQEVEFEQDTALATLHLLDDRLGMVAIVQPREAAFANWRRDVSTNVTLFVITSSILLILIYGFFSQAARAKQADEIYATTRSRIDTALSRGRCGLFDWDLARGRMFWSNSMYDMLGMPPRDDLIGFAEVSELMHPDDGSLFDFVKEVMDENRQIIDRVFRMKHADGSWIWVRARAEQVSQGEYFEPHLIGIAVEITEQKEREEARKTAELRIKEAVELIPEAFVLWDAENRLVMCNTTYKTLNGLSDEDVAEGTPYKEVMKAAKSPISTSRKKENQKRSETRHEYTVALEDGRWFQIAEQRTRDSGWVHVGTDITRVKKEEEESKKRTDKQVELTKKFETEKKRAEEANRSKSDFVANISHELRTPLNAIIGFSDIMRQEMFGELGSEKYKEYTKDINESGKDLLGLINDILDMSKIEAGRMELKFETFDSTEILKEIVKTTDTTAKEKNIAVRMETDKSVQLTADRRSIKQILLNILSNAIKFTETGGSVIVRTHEENGRVLIEVQDTGIGISKKDIAKLGQPFMQLENQMTKTHVGTGLGLNIAQSLVKLHDGEIIIESELNVGTKVTIALPQRLPTDSAQSGSVKSSSQNDSQEEFEFAKEL